MLKTFIVACATLAISASAHADDLIRVKSGKPVKETLDTLQKIVTDDGFFIVGRVPHSEAAKGAGIHVLLLIASNEIVDTFVALLVLLLFVYCIGSPLAL